MRLARWLGSTLLFVAFVCGGTQPVLAAVTAALDRDRIAVGETVRLILQHDGSADGQPDLGPLKRDFAVLSRTSGSSMQFINGRASSSTQITLILAPKRDGDIPIPPLQWGGQTSPALVLIVEDSARPARPGNKEAADSAHVFLTTSQDQKQPYVQAAVVLTLRIYADQPLYEASLEFPASNDVLVKPFGTDTPTTEVRNGRNFTVIERKYLLFPQRSGQISLNGPVLKAQIADKRGGDPFGANSLFGDLLGQNPFVGMMNAVRPLLLHAKPVELNVLPRPASTGASPWFPAQRVILEENWPPDQTSVHVGEPITLHMRLTALGLTGAQLPDLSALRMMPEGIKIYPDQATLTEIPQGDTVLGSRDQNLALIASRPGRYVLPAVRLAWWDTEKQVAREASLPERTLEVLPGVTTTQSPVSASPAAAPSLPVTSEVPSEAPTEASSSVARSGAQAFPWPWLSLALGLLWLSTLVAWWVAHRRRPRSVPGPVGKGVMAVTPNRELKAFQRACADNDPHAARQHLLVWAMATWPTKPPTGLNALALRLNDEKVVAPLRQLDRACYTGSGWQGVVLAQYFASVPVHIIPPRYKPALPELYS